MENSQFIGAMLKSSWESWQRMWHQTDGFTQGLGCLRGEKVAQVSRQMMALHSMESGA